ncbi:MAG: type II toxin-antitoxin system RelE/ParE family toxin [Leptospirales bacterium]|jgi:toxin ParE1/3/4
MARVVWTETALTAVRQITEYIARDSRSAAVRFAREIIDRPEQLEAFPRIGRMIPEFQRDDLRELIHGNYRLLYRIRDDHCYIWTVIHSKRDLQRHIDPEGWSLESPTRDS